MTKYDFDVIYLGGGHGSFDGAGPLAATGQKVAVIESGLWGGTCPNRGCNAKITLDRPVILQREAERMQGLVDGAITINWPALVAHKQEVIRPLPDNIAGKLQHNGATLIEGHGVLQDAHTVTVAGKTYTADKFVIATGLRPHHLAIPGSEFGHDSTDFMALSELPKRIGIVGAGYIAMEFATVANAAGGEVTVFMHGKQALRGFHQPFVEAVIKDLTKRGVTFIRTANVNAFEKDADSYVIDYGDDAAQNVDWILDATGRIPNIEGIGLEAAGVATTPHGITVNDHLQTTAPNIYASGDVIDKVQPKLTPTATFESYYLYQLLAGQTTAAIDYPAIPSTVYTSPRIAKVGVTPEAAASSDELTVVHNHIPDDWYRQIDMEQAGDQLLVFDSGHHLVGATEMSEQAEDAINTLLPAVAFHYDQADMWRLAHIFPSISASAWHKIR
ncbi:NAD(P)/FAD-dependent oxidoreductase [Lacticaseibacillus pabuli]|uniref:NAD(P)/FAD-dependent oxidoreductase n=1 Tax=Lacticaseibacillus pabuli TaxID=3025672 RepID=A0ABY7WUJ2_9LACO|nr:NAD(P)/FAD-dependent oxidoreductase [Lacticaseibacillus sp. KACC 23028]WDF82642.1 NAD(P)/FAD-dependent oxidoreductase [Lacticaseibacillus sp. KACC 23028]